MAHPSTSASLTNPAFDAWLAKRLELVTALNSGGVVATDPKHLLRGFDLQLMPFVCFDDSEPVWVRVRIGDEEVRGYLKVYGASHAPTIFLVSSRFQKKPVAVGSGSVVRYRPYKSKRWRAPKDFHKDQTAFYMLRYR